MKYLVALLLLLIHTTSLAIPLELFSNVIAQIETGGERNPFIRTKYRTAKGSSAYGPYQITYGLLKASLDTLPPKEVPYALMLLERQRISLLVGGKDKTKYIHNREGLFYSQQFGYPSVKAFLEDFDYGGTLGLASNESFKKSYERIAKHLLSITLEQAEGDMVKAAGIWYGGLGNQGTDINTYKEKFKLILEGLTNEHFN